jgi:hypothetical protein
MRIGRRRHHRRRFGGSGGAAADGGEGALTNKNNRRVVLTAWVMWVVFALVSFNHITSLLLSTQSTLLLVTPPALLTNGGSTANLRSTATGVQRKASSTMDLSFLFEKPSNDKFDDLAVSLSSLPLEPSTEATEPTMMDPTALHDQANTTAPPLDQGNMTGGASERTETFQSIMDTADTTGNATAKVESTVTVSASDNLALTPLIVSEAHATVATNALRYDILLAVPGFGNLERLPLLQASIAALQNTMDHDNMRFSCLIYIWRADLIALVQQEIAQCIAIYSPGLWTHHLIRIRPLHAERPTHVIVMMDDMDARTIHLPTLLDTMTRADFTVANPSIPDWQTTSSRSRAHCIAHQTQHVDILFTVFTSSIFFDCFQRQVDPKTNENGWGYDITLADTCPGARIGIVDHQVVLHRPACPMDSAALPQVLPDGTTDAPDEVARWNVTYTDCVGGKPRTYDTDTATAQMKRWIRDSMKLKSDDEGWKFFEYVAFQRPNTLRYCGLVQLALRNKAYYEIASLHRGGWHAVLDGLNDDRVLTLDKQPVEIGGMTNTIDWVDCMEEWFGWGERGAILEPWVGTVHSSPVEDLPGHLAYQALDVLLASEDFRNSSPHCLALFVLTSSLATHLRRKLADLGIAHIKVYAVNHPVTIGANAVLYDPSIDLPAAFSSTSAVVLLGQQYRRIATIYKLKTPRKRLWLPGTDDMVHMLRRRDLELREQQVAFDESVEIVRLEDHADYDRFVRQNIIVLDMWAAVANNAVLECLALHVPCLISKLDGPVEYLGEEYPLFFSSTDELQLLLDDETALQDKMLQAHNYLKLRDKSAYTIEYMGKQLIDYTLHAMADWQPPQIEGADSRILPSSSN